jgi:hypothetical protein
MALVSRIKISSQRREHPQMRISASFGRAHVEAEDAYSSAVGI